VLIKPARSPGEFQEGYAVSKPYQVLPPTAPVPAPNDVLETVVREGARKMLQAVLEEEVDEFLGRRRYQRTDEQHGYRHGHLPKRTVGVGMGAVEVRLPRVSDVPQEVSPDGYHSQIVSRYQRRSRTQARLLVRLYLEGWPVAISSPSSAPWSARRRRCRQTASCG
jgi:hypothetical protein